MDNIYEVVYFHSFVCGVIIIPKYGLYSEYPTLFIIYVLPSHQPRKDVRRLCIVDHFGGQQEDDTRSVPDIPILHIAERHRSPETNQIRQSERAAFEMLLGGW
jgi:hypothetical protein